MHLDKVVEDDPLFLEVRSFDLEWREIKFIVY
jgi:hypothetical protein